jgi:hypothetical protein
MASPTDGLSIQPMRLKVLYTFDAEGKNNCLARWPHVLDIKRAFIDDFTQIGVVDLKICLQTLVASSPELMSQDGLDYTIYAYDYSEEGTPLSGQGMLSSVYSLITQDDSPDEASKVVTGRVTKNVLGLFSSNGQEALEVKFKLLPVAKQVHQRATFNQSDRDVFNESNTYRDEAQGKSNLESNDHRSTTYARHSTGSGSPVDRTGIENMQRMLHEGSVPTESSANRAGESFQPSNSRPASRPGTPNHTQPFNPPARPSFSQASRPSSRASIRTAPPPLNGKRRDSFNSGYYSGDEAQMDEGPPKKRAKITQIGAPSRSDLNIERQPESLRMAASTASSVRVHRPAAINPALGNLQGSNFAEEPVRPPTPIPGAKKPGNHRQAGESSSLRRASQPHLLSNISHPGHAAVDALAISATSPDFVRGTSVSSTPANIPSSPPVMTNYGSMPTSPILPPPPPVPHDSGFMDGLEDMLTGGESFIFEEYLPSGGYTDFQVQPTIEQDAVTQAQNQLTPDFAEGNVVDEDLSKSQLPPPPPPKPSGQPTSAKRPLSRAQSSRPASRPGMSSPKLAPAPYPRARQIEVEMAAQPALPPVAASELAGRHLQRSNTWAGDMSDLLTSDAPTGEVGRAKSASKKKVGREQTKARLENALAQNEMPPYCDNCGTIDTPAWRRVYATTLPGHLYDSVQLLPETQGAFVWKQVVDEAEDGTVKTFRAYKLSKSPEDKGEEWANVTLCNRECHEPQD